MLSRGMLIPLVIATLLAAVFLSPVAICAILVASAIAAYSQPVSPLKREPFAKAERSLFLRAVPLLRAPPVRF